MEALAQILWPDITIATCPWIIEILGAVCVQILAFWLPSMALTSLDYAAPAFAQCHKIQPITKQASAEKIRSCAAVVLQNQLLTLFSRSLLLQCRKRPSFRFDEIVPSPWEITRDCTLAVLGCEIIFYYSHRLLHRPFWYHSIHRHHHRFTAPTALAAQYAPLLEYILSNVLPFEIPARLLDMHIITYYIFLMGATVETVIAHSGKIILLEQLNCNALPDPGVVSYSSSRL